MPATSRTSRMSPRHTTYASDITGDGADGHCTPILRTSSRPAAPASMSPEVVKFFAEIIRWFPFRNTTMFETRASQGDGMASDRPSTPCAAHALANVHASCAVEHSDAAELLYVLPGGVHLTHDTLPGGNTYTHNMLSLHHALPDAVRGDMHDPARTTSEVCLVYREPLPRAYNVTSRRRAGVLLSTADTSPANMRRRPVVRLHWSGSKILSPLPSPEEHGWCLYPIVPARAILYIERRLYYC